VADTPEAQAYRETLIEWGEASEAGEIQAANRLFTLNHSQFKILRKTHEGQTEITALLADTNPYVRSVAATHSLLWSPDEAEIALELEDDEQAPPEVRISAHYTLREWRAGRLNLDW